MTTDPNELAAAAIAAAEAKREEERRSVSPMVRLAGAYADIDAETERRLGEKASPDDVTAARRQESDVRRQVQEEMHDD